MTSARENVRSEFDTVGVVLGRSHREVVSASSVDGSSKGGAVVESVEKAATVAIVVGILPPDFEAIITELDQAIQLEPTISNSKPIPEEQLMDNSEFNSGLVDIEVMDAVSTLSKRLSSGKQIVSCDALGLQSVVCEFNVGKGSVDGTNPIRGRSTRGGSKIKSELPTLQGSYVTVSNSVTDTKPTSKAILLSNANLDGLKQGTWKRVHTKSRPSLHLPLNNVLGAKRSGKEFSCETKKADLAKKKTKVSNNKGFYVLSGEDQITLAKVATQPRQAL